MAFADFDLKTACERFGLTIEERTNLFAAVPAVEVPGRLCDVLETWAPAALAMSTEKARSEVSNLHDSSREALQKAWAYQTTGETPVNDT